MSPDEYCQQKAARHGSSLYYSLLSLSPAARRALTALHAFRRELGESVEEYRDAGVARTKLTWWREEVARLFAGEAQHPVTRALTPEVERGRLEQAHFLDVVAGMQMDLDYDAYPSFTELSLYCHRAAGAVELLGAAILGHDDPATHRYAGDLGMALQLTEIVRNVGRDAARGRVYLPLDEMQRFGVAAEDLRGAETGKAIRDLMTFQARRAREYFARANERLPDAERYAQRSGLAMAQLRQHLLDEIERDGYRVLEHRLSLTPLRKLWIAWRTARREERRNRARG